MARCVAWGRRSCSPWHLPGAALQACRSSPSFLPAAPLLSFYALLALVPPEGGLWLDLATFAADFGEHGAAQVGSGLPPAGGVFHGEVGVMRWGVRCHDVG